MSQNREQHFVMKLQDLKPIAIGCFIICVVCLFIAFERYQANASNVSAVQQMAEAAASPFIKVRPATPVATKYALFFAFLAGTCGVIAWIQSQKRTSE